MKAQQSKSQSTDSTTIRSTTRETGQDPISLDTDTIETVRRCILAVGKRVRMRPEELDDFTGIVWLKLLDQNSAVLRQHQGKSRLSTYLTAVIHNLAQDQLRSQRGKWRPSKLASRLGQTATRLEELCHRDERSLREAAATIVSERPRLSASHVIRLAESLPNRRPRPKVESNIIDQLGTTGGVESGAKNGEQVLIAARAKTVLESFLAELSEPDRSLVRRRFGKGEKISHIARSEGIEPRIAYRKLESMLRQLKQRFGQVGLRDLTGLVNVRCSEIDLHLDSTEQV